MAIDFDKILTAFEAARLSSTAKDRAALEEDCVTAARRGWTASSPSTPWPDGAEPAVREYFTEDLTADVLSVHGAGAQRWALFASFATGWLFSMRTRGELDELAAYGAFARLPGFMWMNEERLTAGR